MNWYKGKSIAGIGQGINDAGREFKRWFTDFSLVYSPIFIVVGLILTGLDVFLNLGIGNWTPFKVLWSLAQLFAVEGLWFAIWNRILTDDYKWSLFFYHTFVIILGLCMTGIAVVMNYIIFTQDYLGLKDGMAAMRYIGIPVAWFLGIRAILLMATATIAIVLDKVMRKKDRYTASTIKTKPVEKSSIDVIPETKPDAVPLLNPPGYKASLRAEFEKYKETGEKLPKYSIIAAKLGCSEQMVKSLAPALKKELGL